MKDVYTTIKSHASSLVKVKGSKFFGFVWPVLTEEEALERLDESRKAHPAARHHCFAWRFGVEGHRYRSSDDGEPGGTAGKPILGQLISSDLTGVMAIVVRYFGGTLLGTSGLIQAYRESAAQAISQAEIVERVIEDVVRIDFSYARMPQVMNAIKALNLEMSRHDFGVVPAIEINVRQSKTREVVPVLWAKILGLHLAEITPELQQNSDLAIEVIQSGRI